MPLRNSEDKRLVVVSVLAQRRKPKQEISV